MSKIFGLDGLAIGVPLRLPRCGSKELWSEEHQCAVLFGDRGAVLESPEILPFFEGEFTSTLCGRYKPALAKEVEAHPGCGVVKGETRESQIRELEVDVAFSPQLTQQLLDAFGPAPLQTSKSSGSTRFARRWWLPNYQRLTFACNEAQDECYLSLRMAIPAAAQKLTVEWAQALQRAIAEKPGVTPNELVTSLPATVPWQYLTSYVIGSDWVLPTIHNARN